MLISLVLAATLNGAYTLGGHTVYAGPENYNGRSTIEYFDPTTRIAGKLPAGTALGEPSVRVVEESHTATDAQGPIGFSLWHVENARAMPTIVLIHGADQETRDMGFLIPYFVSHGMNVVSFDQRGTGTSSGNWQATGPEQKAEDVLAILHAIEHDAAVDPGRLGVWGPSNGGWVAPIVATHYPLAFMILKSPAAESIESNVRYEVEQTLREHGQFSQRQIAEAMRFESAMFYSLRTNTQWPRAQRLLDQARTQPWFAFMRIPPGLTAPPPPAVMAALRAGLEFDPQQTLQHVHVPTLVVFGALDKNIDVADSARLFRADFAKAHLRDYTIHTFAGADHLLERSATGYIDESADPSRLVPGYPEIMIDWLAAHGLPVSRP